jgi:hypothetical protein
MKGTTGLFANDKPNRKRARSVVHFTPTQRERQEFATVLDAQTDPGTTRREIAVTLPILTDWEVMAVSRLIVALLKA